MPEINYTQLSKIVSHALRHEPQSYNLTLDENGWVSIIELASAIGQKGITADVAIITDMVTKSAKKRHEILNGKIRAYYGHSIPDKILKNEAEPPEFLYHGTIEDNLNDIKTKGLLPMGRQYVHLSTDEEIAKKVGSRKEGNLIVLKINAKEAYQNHVKFFGETNGIWLSENVPSIYIQWNLLK
jgi:putative RNA 2'-phosphotransferase